MDRSHPRLAPPDRSEQTTEPRGDLPLPERPPPLAPYLERLRELVDRVGPSRWVAGVAGLVLVILVGVFWMASQRTSSPPIETSLPLATPIGPTSTTVPDRLTVHAAGAVIHPGLHVVASGARVADVVSAAGGLTAAADLDRVNLAALVVDAERVYIPRVGEAVPAEVRAGAADSDSPPGQIDINAADRDLLDTLPGIGPATADAIAGYREQVGPFTSVEGLLEVPGIGPAKLEQLRDRVRVG